jgi:hypothetical protein
MKLIRDIVQGAGYLEGFGEHPGTDFLFIFVLMGAIGGALKGGGLGALAGALAMIVFVGPLWCIGCVGRARDYQKRNRQ